jgi:Zinc finger, C3HC4 type (RING finger)
MSQSYDRNNADIRVKIGNVWHQADEQQKAAYIAYKSRNHYYREIPHTHGNGITISRECNNNNPENNDDPYMPTYFKLAGSVRNPNTKHPIIDMNDIHVFLMDGVSGTGSRNGAGWVNARNYQAWAYVDFIYDTTATRKCYMTKYSTYLAFPPGFDCRNVVTIDIDDLPPNIIFSISRNDNNSVYYERNDPRSTRVRICDNEYARIGFLGFFTRITMDSGIIVTPSVAQVNGNTVICDGILPPLVETMDEEEQCILCYKYKKNIVYEPCNHVISCYECFEKLVRKECPVCKTVITKIKKHM